MRVAEVQILLKKNGNYAGAIDGDPGRGTRAAVKQIERTSSARYSSRPGKWTWKRRVLGAGQAVLDAYGFEPGPVDGWSGARTAVAWSKFATAHPDLVEQKPSDPEPASAPCVRSHPEQMQYPRQSGMAAFYGPPGGKQCVAGRVRLPFPMYLSWDASAELKTFRCHAKLVEPLTNVFEQALDHYGIDGVQELQLDQFGGCYNYRPMRGGRRLSTHAFGAAIDLNPGKNRLRWGARRAQFAKPEYEKFFEIVMQNGGTPAGYAWGKDWMHIQWARL